MEKKEFRDMSIEELEEFISDIKDQIDAVAEKIESDKESAPEEEEARANQMLEEKRAAMEMLEAKKEEAEKRARVEAVEKKELEVKPIEEERKTMNEAEVRAQNFVETGKMEVRILLSDKAAKPIGVLGIEGMAEQEAGIIDDVNVVAANGIGGYTVAVKTANPSADAVTEGAAIPAGASGFDYVTINPQQVGVIDEISRNVAKLSPLQYEAAVADAIATSIREAAAVGIIQAVATSDKAEAVTVAIGPDYLRKLVLGYKAIAGKGEPVLYIAQADLAALSAVRGTNEKRPLYEFNFDEGTTRSGMISEGGIAVKFRALDCLTAGTQYFGQPKNITVATWGETEVTTDEGGEYFKRNMIGIRGLQMAGMALVAKNGMQKVANK